MGALRSRGALVEWQGFEEKHGIIAVALPQQDLAILDAGVRGGNGPGAGPRLRRFLVDEILEIVEGAPTRFSEQALGFSLSPIEPLAGVGSRCSRMPRAGEAQVALDGDAYPVRNDIPPSSGQFMGQLKGIHERQVQRRSRHSASR